MSNSQGTVIVGRRALNSSAWTLVTTPYTLSNNGDDIYSGAIDDHDIVAMAVDGNGDICDAAGAPLASPPMPGHVRSGDIN